jgi:hypothetical protein
VQNITAALASNSSNPFFVALGIQTLTVIDPDAAAKAAAAAEAAAKNQQLLIIGVSVAVGVILIMLYVSFRLGRGIIHK